MVQLANASGAIVRTYDYDAFGNQRNVDPNDTNLFRYCAEMWDSNAGTYYLRNRCYTPATGRFTQEDPIRSGRNWYTYADNNPVMFHDPLGLFPFTYNAAGQRVVSSTVEGQRARNEQARQQWISNNTVAVQDSAGNWRAPPSTTAGDGWYAPPQTGGGPIIESVANIAAEVLVRGLNFFSVYFGWASNLQGLDPLTRTNVRGLSRFLSFYGAAASVSLNLIRDISDEDISDMRVLSNTVTNIQIEIGVASIAALAAFAAGPLWGTATWYGMDIVLDMQIYGDTTIRNQMRDNNYQRVRIPETIVVDGRHHPIIPPEELYRFGLPSNSNFRTR